MYRALGAAALLSIAIAAPVQEAAAQDPVGGALLGGACRRDRRRSVGRRARGRSRRGRRRGDWRCHCCAGPTAAGRLPLLPAGLLSTAWRRRWVAVAPQYCAPAAAAPVAVAPPPPPRVVRDELGDRMMQLREGCEDGDRRACVRLGIIIGENRERRASWRREHPEVFFYER